MGERRQTFLARCRVSARKSVVTIGLAIVAGLPIPARASEESSFETLQPIWTFSGLSRSHVTVTTYNEGDPAIAAVLATCDSNQVMTPYGPQQRNAAFAVGLRTEVTFNAAKDPPLFGDTLRVVLRVTKPPADLDDISFATILGETLDCILTNAARSKAVRFVSLRVEGSTTYRKYGRVYSTAGFRSGQSKKEPVGR